MRILLCILLCSSVALPALAQSECPIERAIYAERDNGYELRFREGRPWEYPGMTGNVFELVMPDGRELWGRFHSNMGTSRDEGSIFFGCSPPTDEDYDDMTEAEIAACRVWNGVVYGMADGEPGFVPSEGEAAPPGLLLTDLGRVVRYSGLVEGPGDEPWDYFELTGCAP